MRSSTSSSDIYIRKRRIPDGPWARPFVIAGVVFVTLVILLELALARHGFEANIIDTPQRWAHERQRADDLGGRAVILVGASRVQLDLDLATLGRESGKMPVQLGIDGNSFGPVLADLADDERVVGTVIVEYQDTALGEMPIENRAKEYVREGSRERNQVVKADYKALEAWLVSIRQALMRSYADGAGPLVALTNRALATHATTQYLTTLPSRERSADYTLVSMPYTYFDRVARNAGIVDLPLRGRANVVESALTARIDGMPQENFPHFTDNARMIGAAAHRIEARGGKVIFIAFPRTGLVWTADRLRYPRAMFWDRFISVTGVSGLHFMDVPLLTTFQCPDGSHLDVRDKVRFTRALARTLAEDGWLPRSQ